MWIAEIIRLLCLFFDGTRGDRDISPCFIIKRTLKYNIVQKCIVKANSSGNWI